MNFLRDHWFDLGIALALIVGLYVLVAQPPGLAGLLWLSLITLFLHQFEEYRYPGYFPGMVNTAMYASAAPDRYPLNSHTALAVNVLLGWLLYGLAALLNTRALWLGIATLVVSAGNVLAHTFLFNLRGRTRYNPGMLTSLVLFLPLVSYCGYWVVQTHAATARDWGVGLVLGAAINYLGILRLIEGLKDANTRYVFPPRCLIPGPRPPPGPSSATPPHQGAGRRS